MHSISQHITAQTVVLIYIIVLFRMWPKKLLTRTLQDPLTHPAHNGIAKDLGSISYNAFILRSLQHGLLLALHF